MHRNVQTSVAEAPAELSELPANPASAAPRLETGQLERVEGGVLLVWTGSRTERAKRAPACVVMPEPGDRVLLAHADGRAYVLAVLERHNEATAERWAASGDLVIEAQAGRVDVRASQGVGLTSGADVTVRAQALKMDARVADVAFSKFRLLGQDLLVEMAHSKLVSRAIETVADVVQQTATKVSRVVTEIDQLRAGTIDIAAQKTMAVHAENAVVTAKSLVKVDGEAVQLG